MKFSLLTLALLACAPSLLGAQTIDERKDMQANGRLEVSNTAGSVEIIGWKRNVIEVTGELSSEYDELGFEVDGGDAYININPGGKNKGFKNRGKHRHGNGSAELVIRVPVSTRLNVNTVSANITVENISESQRLQSVSGDIETQLAGREGVIKTVSGEIDIEANGKQERMIITTVSGDIDATEISGELSISTVSGDLDISATRISRLDSHTVSGDLEFVGQLNSGGAIDVDSVNGDIELRLVSLFDTEFHLETFHGDILPIFDQKAQRKSRYAPGQILRFTEGDGRSRIRVETLNGDIDVIATGSQRRKPKINRKQSDNMPNEED